MDFSAYAQAASNTNATNTNNAKQNSYARTPSAIPYVSTSHGYPTAQTSAATTPQMSNLSYPMASYNSTTTVPPPPTQPTFSSAIARWEQENSELRAEIEMLKHKLRQETWTAVQAKEGDKARIVELESQLKVTSQSWEQRLATIVRERDMARQDVLVEQGKVAGLSALRERMEKDRRTIDDRLKQQAEAIRALEEALDSETAKRIRSETEIAEKNQRLLELSHIERTGQRIPPQEMNELKRQLELKEMQILDLEKKLKQVSEGAVQVCQKHVQDMEREYEMRWQKRHDEDVKMFRDRELELESVWRDRLRTSEERSMRQLDAIREHFMTIGVAVPRHLLAPNTPIVEPRQYAQIEPNYGPSNGTLQKLESQYSPSHEMLILGDGDFSFSISLMDIVGSGRRIVATSYPLKTDLVKHHPPAARNIEKLTSKGVRVYFGVDATALEICAPLRTGCLIALFSTIRTPEVMQLHRMPSWLVPSFEAVHPFSAKPTPTETSPLAKCT